MHLLLGKCASKLLDNSVYKHICVRAIQHSYKLNYNFEYLSKWWHVDKGKDMLLAVNKSKDKYIA